MTEQEPRKEVKREKVIPPRPVMPGDAMMTTGQEVVASNLSPQLGTDAKDLTKGGVDMRRLTVLTEPLQAALAYFSWRGGGQEFPLMDRKGIILTDDKGSVKKRVRRGVRFWSHISEYYLNSSPSIDGRGRRQLIEMQRATTPGAAIPPEPEAPGWLKRNVTERNWKDKTEKY